MKRTLTALPLAALLYATAAQAEERCVAAQYRLPESLAEDMRPYILCGLFQGRYGHVPVRLNGQSVFMTGAGAESCGGLRQATLEASEARLAATMPDANARRSFVLAEFEKADQFLRVAARSEDLSVGEEPSSPQCRISDAQNR